MKKIECNLKDLINIINNYKYTERVHVIYNDVLEKEKLNDDELINAIQDDDNLYDTGKETIFFVRDCPIEVYMKMLYYINEQNDTGYKCMNKIVPTTLIDYKAEIIYKIDVNDEYFYYEMTHL